MDHDAERLVSPSPSDRMEFAALGHRGAQKGAMAYDRLLQLMGRSAEQIDLTGGSIRFFKVCIRIPGGIGSGDEASLRRRLPPPGCIIRNWPAAEMRQAIF